MTDFWRRAKPFVFSALCVLLALYLSPLSIWIGYGFSTHDLAPLWAKVFNLSFVVIFTLFFGLFVALAAFCVAVSAAIEAYQLRATLAPKFYYGALFCVVYVACWTFFPKVRSAWPLRRAGLERAATRAKPLVVAIKKFRTEKKRAPYNLQELVPNYLPAIPSTGMAAYPQFRYATREERGENAKFQIYQLQIRTSIGFLNWDTFNYWPEGDYPAQINGGRVERIGAWAYVHE